MGGQDLVEPELEPQHGYPGVSVLQLDGDEVVSAQLAGDGSETRRRGGGRGAAEHVTALSGLEVEVAAQAKLTERPVVQFLAHEVLILHQ